MRTERNRISSSKQIQPDFTVNIHHAYSVTGSAQSHTDLNNDFFEKFCKLLIFQRFIRFLFRKTDACEHLHEVRRRHFYLQAVAQLENCTVLEYKVQLFLLIASDA